MPENHGSRDMITKAHDALDRNDHGERSRNATRTERPMNEGHSREVKGEADISLEAVVARISEGENQEQVG